MILTVTLNAAIDKRYVVSNFTKGEVNRVKTCEYTPGGKGLNVSKPAKIAGAEVLATGLIGGYAGEYIESILRDMGISTGFYYLQEESRSCINIWDETEKSQTEFLEPGFFVTEEIFDQFVSRYESLLEKTDVVVISGSVPRGLDGTAYQTLIHSAKQKKKKVVLDTSGDLLTMGIEAIPTMIKPNIDEIRMLTGKSCGSVEEITEAVKILAEKGIEIVVVSLGAQGSIVACDGCIYQVSVPKIEAENTVGCGDAMTAGFAIGLDRKLSMEDTIQMASAMSVAAALRKETGFFLMEDMESMLPKIKLSKI